MAVTDRFDGRLTRISMLAAYLLALGAIIRLGWRVRVLVRGDRAGRAVRGDLGRDRDLRRRRVDPALPRRAGVGVPRGAALGRRARPGLLRRARPLVGRADREGWRGLAWAAGSGRRGAAVPTLRGRRSGRRPWAWSACASWCGSGPPRPVAPRRGPGWPGSSSARCCRSSAYAAINQAKFGSPYELPIEKQVLVSFDPARQAALEANDGSLFGLQFAPSVPWQAVRPDGVGGAARSSPSSGSRPTARPRWGDVVFAERDWSSSVPASEPLLVVLGLIGVVALLVPDRMAAGAAVRVLRLPVVGAAAGGVGVLVLGYMANRYLSDLIPLLVLTTTLGAAVVGGWARGPEPAGPRRRARWARGARPVGSVGEHVARAPVPAGDRARGAGRLAGDVARVAGAARSRTPASPARRRAIGCRRPAGSAASS